MVADGTSDGACTVDAERIVAFRAERPNHRPSKHLVSIPFVAMVIIRSSD